MPLNGDKDRPRVLLVGFDPHTIPGLDVEQMSAALARGQARFAELGLDAEQCLVPPDETIPQRVTSALRREAWACVVVGGGIRKPEQALELFEEVVNLIRVHAPGAEIAFNTSGEDSADAALRRLRARAQATTGAA